MSTTSSATTYNESNSWLSARKETIAAYKDLSKPRIAVMGLVAVAIGFAMGNVGAWDWLLLAKSLFGIGAVAISSSMLNQYLERHSDQLMDRTATRPLPSGRISANRVLLVGSLTGLFGVLFLAWQVNLLTAALSAFTLLSYVAIYTPLKRKTAFCTTVGAIPGALPPLLGWTAVRGTVDLEGIVLFAILFLWQFPHFLAIIWIYREQYQKAGLKMMPFGQPAPKAIGFIAIANAVALIPISLLPRQLGMTGDQYFWAALVLGIGYLFSSIHFFRYESTLSARRLVWTSLIYLPLLLIVMLWDHLQIL